MNLQIVDDMVFAATGDLGSPAPLHLAGMPVDRLRFVDGEVIDADTLTTFYIATHGMRHAVPGEGRQPLACRWDDVLFKDGDTWRVRLPSDDLTEGLLRMRARRDRMLKGCDWTQLADSPLTDDQRSAWRDYRQALRDLPEASGHPDTIAWPDRPE